MKNKNVKEKFENRDPITGELGSHPVGTGVGAIAGGAAAGAAIGTVAGPVGTALGTALGAVVGGLAGKGVAESVNPTVEDNYWRTSHPYQSYAQGRPYEEFSPAYRSGYEGYSAFGGSTSFEENEAAIRHRYESFSPKLSWHEARPASLAAWEKFDGKRI
jgi:hypothetical protein